MIYNLYFNLTSWFFYGLLVVHASADGLEARLHLPDASGQHQSRPHVHGPSPPDATTSPRVAGPLAGRAAVRGGALLRLREKLDRPGQPAARAASWAWRAVDFDGRRRTVRELGFGTLKDSLKIRKYFLKNHFFL